MTDDTDIEDVTTVDDASARDDATPADNRTPNNGPSDDGMLGRLSAGDARGLLDRVGLGALVLLALVAGWSVYDQAGEAIRLWVDPAFQPVVLAAFNLAILLVALAGITHQLVRIRGG
jgi:hypothetical protein